MPDRWDAEARKEDIREALRVHLLTHRETGDLRPIADWVAAPARRAQAAGYRAGLERAFQIMGEMGNESHYLAVALRREIEEFDKENP